MQAKIHKIFVVEEDGEVIDPILHKKLTYNPDGEITEELVFYPDGEIQERHETTFNEKGFISTEKIYLEGDELDYFSTYTYEDDAVVKITEEYADPDENQTRVFEYSEGIEKMTVYDANNEILSIEIRGVNQENQVIWEEIRDENAELMARQEFDFTSFGEYQEVREFNGDVKRVRKYNYNAQNKLVEMIIYEEADIIAKLTYEYDANGNPILEVQETPNGFFRTENVYDDKNQLISNKIFAPNEVLLESYDFEYNEHGLVVTESYFRLDSYNDLVMEGKFSNTYEYFS